MQIIAMLLFFRQRMCRVVQQPPVQMETHVVNWPVVNGDVVLYQMLSAAPMACTAAPMVIRVMKEHAPEDLM